MRSPVETVRGRIVGYDERRGELLIRAPYDDVFTMTKREFKTCLVQPIDSRPLSDKQRNFTYIRQVNVQMFAKFQEESVMPKAEIVSYGLLPEEYDNFFLSIDPARIQRHPVIYNPDFIGKFLKNLAYLRDCLLNGVFP